MRERCLQMEGGEREECRRKRKRQMSQHRHANWGISPKWKTIPCAIPEPSSTYPPSRFQTHEISQRTATIPNMPNNTMPSPPFAPPNAGAAALIVGSAVTVFNTTVVALLVVGEPGIFPRGGVVIVGGDVTETVVTTPAAFVVVTVAIVGGRVVGVPEAATVVEVDDCVLEVVLDWVVEVFWEEEVVEVEVVGACGGPP